MWTYGWKFCTCPHVNIWTYKKVDNFIKMGLVILTFIPGKMGSQFYVEYFAIVSSVL